MPNHVQTYVKEIPLHLSASTGGSPCKDQNECLEKKKKQKGTSSRMNWLFCIWLRYNHIRTQSVYMPVLWCSQSPHLQRVFGYILLYLIKKRFCWKFGDKCLLPAGPSSVRVQILFGKFNVAEIRSSVSKRGYCHIIRVSHAHSLSIPRGWRPK